MTQTLELEALGFRPMSKSELVDTDGGWFLKWIITQVVANWDEIKRGASDGWNGRPYAGNK